MLELKCFGILPSTSSKKDAVNQPLKIEDLRQFLTEHVDGYLLGDLQTLEGAGPNAGTECGAAGYPLLATVFRGSNFSAILSPLPRLIPMTPGRAETDSMNSGENIFIPPSHLKLGQAMCCIQLREMGLLTYFS